MSSNIVIGYNNQADGATLTGGTWTGLNNLKDYRLGTAATASDSDGVSYLRFALPSPVHIGILAIIAANTALTSTQHWRLFSDAGFSDVIYDSAVVDAYPPGTEPYGSAPWGHPSVWTGRPVQDDLARYQRNLVHVLGNATMAQYGDVQLRGAAAATWDTRRLFIGQTLRPEIGVGYGALRLQPKTRTQRQDARDGTPYFDKLRAAFAMPITLDWLTQAESMRALDAQVISDISGEVLAVFQPDDPAYRNRHTLFGRLAELDPIEFPQYATYRNAYQLEGYL